MRMQSPAAPRRTQRGLGPLVNVARSRKATRQEKPAAANPRLQPAATGISRGRAIFGGAILLCGLWSYWPTLVNLAGAWSRIADYAHGFFVIPLALYFLWVNRDRYPGCRASSPLLALLLLAFSLLLRHTGDAFYFTFLDGWSLVPWAAAVCAALGGRPLLAWCAPSLVFLLFMVPLPFSLEGELSGPLQRIATILSTHVLQFLGQPGFAEGHVIVLGQQRLEVAQACSGLRLFLGIIALTFAYVVVLRRPLWEKLALILATAPIAVISNAGRIVATGLLYHQLQPGPSMRAWIHDAAGWGMLLAAAALFGAWLWYLRRLVKEEEVMDMVAIVKQCPKQCRV